MIILTILLVKGRFSVEKWVKWLNDQDRKTKRRVKFLERSAVLLSIADRFISIRRMNMYALIRAALNVTNGIVNLTTKLIEGQASKSYTHAINSSHICTANSRKS